MADPSPLSLSNLIATTCHHNALSMDPRAANLLLGPGVSELLSLYKANQVAKDLHTTLTRFGWSLQEGFTSMLDLPGFRSALQKLKWTQVDTLGMGTFGIVHKARDRETGDYVAIKQLLTTAGTDAGLPVAGLREVNALQALQHENIVRLIDIIATAQSSSCYLVLECCDCDLRCYMDRDVHAGALPHIKSIMQQILRGLHHAHARLFMHRDLKPQNILVDTRSGRVKLSDFGLARRFAPGQPIPYTDKVVTLAYRAPELLLCSRTYTHAVDLWSVGCIFAELVNFGVFFRGDTEIEVLYGIFERLGTPSPAAFAHFPSLPASAAQGVFPCWPGKPLAQLVPRLAHDPDALDLLSRLLSINPCTRISAKQALQHPWFTQDPNLQQAHPAAMLPRATGQSPTTGVAGLRVGWTGAGGMMGGQGQAAATAQAAMPVDTGVVEMAH